MTRALLLSTLCLLTVGVATPALATSPACQCHPEDETVTAPPAVACLRFSLFWTCDQSHVTNDCTVPVELLGWEHVAAGTTLAPHQELSFTTNSGVGSAAVVQTDYRVSVAGKEETIRVAYARVCPMGPASPNPSGGHLGGCVVGGPTASARSNTLHLGMALVIAGWLLRRTARRRSRSR